MVISRFEPLIKFIWTFLFSFNGYCRNSWSEKNVMWSILMFCFCFCFTELMLMGFISLLLTVSQNGIVKICVPQDWTHHMLPCSYKDEEHEQTKTPTSHFQTSFSFSGTVRRLLADAKPATEAEPGYCARKVLIR